MSRASRAGGAEPAALQQLLRRRGFRVTDQRMQILTELAKRGRPLSHAEITDSLATIPLDRTTIYRNLVALADAGVLVRVQLGDPIWRFELPAGEEVTHGVHPHFLCMECQELSCLPGRAVRIDVTAVASSVESIQIRGRCHACADAKNSTPRPGVGRAISRRRRPVA